MMDDRLGLFVRAIFDGQGIPDDLKGVTILTGSAVLDIWVLDFFLNGRNVQLGLNAVQAAEVIRGLLDCGVEVRSYWKDSGGWLREKFDRRITDGMRT